MAQQLLLPQLEEVHIVHCTRLSASRYHCRNGSKCGKEGCADANILVYCTFHSDESLSSLNPINQLPVVHRAESGQLVEDHLVADLLAVVVELVEHLDLEQARAVAVADASIDTNNSRQWPNQ